MTDTNATSSETNDLASMPKLQELLDYLNSKFVLVREPIGVLKLETGHLYTVQNFGTLTANLEGLNGDRVVKAAQPGSNGKSAASAAA